jgi:DIE2/ALG10 family
LVFDIESSLKQDLNKMMKTLVEPAVAPGRAPVTTLAILFSVVTFHLFVSMHTSVPDPYMDEIFHIKQARTYCDGNFTEVPRKPPLYFFLQSHETLIAVGS